MPDGVSTTGSRLRASWSSVTLPPTRLPDGLLVLRSPALADAPVWSAARLANRGWLERAFPAWGSDWAAEQSEVAWVQRCWRLRRLALLGRAKPFVMTLEGALIGEIGIDAVDELSGAGEASVWMVRAHGSPTVMQAASLLLIQHAFTGRHPLNRIVSPVATTSRAGRAPGLSAVGFEIEATVPRRVGSKGLVDHDMWVLHNTEANRRTLVATLRSLAVAEPHPDDPPAEVRGPDDAAAGRRRQVAAAATRAALREARAAARAARTVAARYRADSGTKRVLPVSGSGRQASLRPASRRDLAALDGVRVADDATRWALETDGRVEAVIGHRTDAGTGTTEVVATMRPGTSRDVLAAGISAVLDDVRPAPDEPRVVTVRVPSGVAAGTAPDADLLGGLGLTRVATYRGTCEGPHSWGGEEVWRLTPAG